MNVGASGSFPARVTQHAHVGAVKQGALLVAANRFATWLRATLQSWRRRVRERRELRAMTDLERREIGLSACDVARETTKPFWRA